jgi:hypothetical protein
LSTDVVKRFVSSNGVTFFSIRRRSDGNYQIYRDGAFLEDGTQPYYMEDKPVSGLFGDVAAAEEEMLRSRMNCKPVAS